MFTEVINTLYITYIATEYNNLFHTRHQHDTKTNNNNNNIRIISIVTILVLCWNIFNSMIGFDIIVYDVLYIVRYIYHIPRIILVVISYIITLYYDCYYSILRVLQLQQQQQLQQYHTTSTTTTTMTRSTSSPKLTIICLTWKSFLPRIVQYYIRILPIYPIMAICISFIFLFIISLFETLHISTDILNGPIYYGTLYGPFSYIYYHVKQDLLYEYSSSTSSSTILPHHTTTTSSSTGGIHALTVNSPFMKVESATC